MFLINFGRFFIKSTFLTDIDILVVGFDHLIYILIHNRSNIIKTGQIQSTTAKINQKKGQF